MSALAELQRSLQTHVLRPQSTRVAAVARAAVIDSAAADSAQRLGIYSHAYRARLLEVLGNDFPGLRALAGAETFEQLGLGYIEANPSPYYNVRWYGARLADYLGKTASWSVRPEFVEMAALEWSMGLAFDATDARVVDVAEVAAVAAQDWPRLGLRLHASLQRQTLRWNVNAIRRAVDGEEPVPPLQALESPQVFAIWRKDSSVRYRRLEQDEAAALDLIAHGATFTQLCELLCDWHAIDAVARRAAGLFRVWIEDQWVGALELADA
ncbi:MAG: DNA-binding domain-containing protein [Dokdonella sp.]